VAVAGNYCYLANDGDGLRIYDISTPANAIPVWHANTNYGGHARGLAIAGNYLYLANLNDGLRVYNISNPANPVSVAHTNYGGSAYGVAMRGTDWCLWPIQRRCASL